MFMLKYLLVFVKGIVLGAKITYNMTYNYNQIDSLKCIQKKF